MQDGEVKILLVDDNPNNLKVLNGALAAKGYKVLIANGGARALQIVQTALPHLVLLDINMPDMNGYEVCKAIKANEKTFDIPVIFVSAMDNVADKIQGFQVGAVDYITKPFNKEELSVRIENQLKVQRLTRKLESQNEALQESYARLQHAQALVEEQNASMTDSIQYALRLQQAIMPSAQELKKFFQDSFIFFLPKSIVSGDFYWFHQRRNKIFLAVADCTGHGVPGAFMSLIGINGLNKLVEERGITEPASILEELDYEIETTLNQKGEGAISKDGMDLAICAFDFRLNAMQYACAMRNIILISNGQLLELKGERYSVGGAQYDLNAFTNHRMDLKPGDVLYLYSDGITDQFGGEHQRKFTPKRLTQLMLDIHALPMEQQKVVFYEEFHKWKGDSEQMDDVLIVGLRYKSEG